MQKIPEFQRIYPDINILISNIHAVLYIYITA